MAIKVSRLATARACSHRWLLLRDCNSIKVKGKREKERCCGVEWMHIRLFIYPRVDCVSPMTQADTSPSVDPRFIHRYRYRTFSHLRMPPSLAPERRSQVADREAATMHAGWNPERDKLTKDIW